MRISDWSSDVCSSDLLARRELLPPEEACGAERRLHHDLLMRHPRRPVDPGEIAAIEDADARENWELMIAFRDRLLAAPSLEAAYLALAHGNAGATPPIFMTQQAHVVLRNSLQDRKNAVEGKTVSEGVNLGGR